MTRRPLVVGIGRCWVDFVGVAPRLPDGDAPVPLSQIAVQVGGVAPVALATANALGCRSRIATRLADDFLAAFAMRALTEAGIDSELVVRDRGQLSPLSFTAMSADRRDRHTFTMEGDVADLAPEAVDLALLLDGADALLVDGTFPAAQIAAAEAARAAHIPVIFDGSHKAEGTGELVALSDVLISSERLAAELAPCDRLPDSLADLCRLGPRAAIITMGETGSIGLHDDALVEHSAPLVDAVDPAGAGEVYFGAFVAALLGGLPFAQCMELASAAAALSCTQLGAWAGIPTRAETVALVKRGRDHDG